MMVRTVALGLLLAASATIAANTTRAQYEDPSESGYPHIEVGFDVGVMLWNGVDRDIVRPGGTVDARIGWNYKWWVPMLALGFRGNGLNLQNVSGAPVGTHRETLTNIFFALGMRFVTPNRTRVAPFLDGWFDFNWWNLNETQVVCNVWYCTGVNQYRFTPGFHGRIGMQIRVAPQADLEIGFGAGYSFQGQFFLRNRSWLEPSVGFTYSFVTRTERRSRATDSSPWSRSTEVRCGTPNLDASPA
ncbi:MAG: hypothetical protein JRJ64_05075 [Deltaproteobacteria bacterium]|nr:hypothetical protein [Deltaproteobacteria bacterium]